MKLLITILIISFVVGIISAHFFKGNKQADLIEECVEKIIEHETGIALDFDELDEKISESSSMKLSEPISNPLSEFTPQSIP